MSSPALPARRTVAMQVLATAALAAAAHLLFVLPAEYHYDPTGFGAWTGLVALSAPVPPPQIPTPTTGAPLAYSSRDPFRSDTIRIPVDPDAQLEYKVRMKKGQGVVYSWSVDKGEVYYDFHGEPPGDPDKSQSYETGTSRTAHGAVIAPLDGIHGWQFINQEGHPIVVTVKLSGFYELIP